MYKMSVLESGKVTGGRWDVNTGDTLCSGDGCVLVLYRNLIYVPQLMYCM